MSLGDDLEIDNKIFSQPHQVRTGRTNFACDCSNDNPDSLLCDTVINATCKSVSASCGVNENMKHDLTALSAFSALDTWAFLLNFGKYGMHRDRSLNESNTN